MSNDKETEKAVSPIEEIGAEPTTPNAVPLEETEKTKKIREEKKKRTGLSDQVSEEKRASDEIDQLPDTPKPTETKPMIDPKTVEKATSFLGKAGEKLAGGLGKAMETFSRFMDKFAPILQKITGALDKIKEQFARSMGKTLVSLEGENKLLAGMRGNMESFLGIYGIFYKNASRRNIEIKFGPKESAKDFIKLYRDAVTAGVEDNFDKFFLGLSKEVKSKKKGAISFTDFMKISQDFQKKKIDAANKKNEELAKKEEEKKKKKKKKEKEKKDETKIA